MTGPREQPAQLDLQFRRPTPAEEAEAERVADVHSGRAYEWQAGQDAYERWLNEIAP